MTDWPTIERCDHHLGSSDGTCDEWCAMAGWPMREYYLVRTDRVIEYELPWLEVIYVIVEDTDD